MVNYDPLIQNIELSPDHHTDVLRLDLLHPEISGNKWFKLSRNLEDARLQNKKTILTFGGAFSNHIAATAAACGLNGFQSIGIIRGEDDPENATLAGAREKGMQIVFKSRSDYAQKDTPEFLDQLAVEFDEPYIIPEGGNNAAGILGCQGILKPEWNYDYIFCACGTAATYTGLLLAVKPGTTVIGISVLKGENHLPAVTTRTTQQLFPERTIRIQGNEVLKDNVLNTHAIVNVYCFSGYAKYDPVLVEYKKGFERKHAIPLDYVYTNKLFYAVSDLLLENKLPTGSKALIIHSGGLQGNAGFEKRFRVNL